MNKKMKPYYKIVFSVPVHEKLDVVVDQCVNFLHFNPQCAIILHISEGFNFEHSSISFGIFKAIIGEIGDIYINPNRLKTGFMDIIQAHISNYIHISSICNYEYYSMCASNDLFIKEGLYAHINRYDAGLDIIEVPTNTTWEMGKLAYQDESLKEMLQLRGGGNIIGAQIEGSYYKKELYFEIVDIINKFYNYKTKTLKYAREEIYFASVLFLIAKSKALNINNIGKYTWINWSSKTLFVSILDVKKLLNSQNRYFCVKRCDRDNKDVLRSYIRQRSGYFDKISSYLKDIKKLSKLQIFCMEICRVLVNSYDRLIVCVKRLLLKMFR